MSNSSIEGGKFFFIVGAPKAGTYSLYETLTRHPDISMSRQKEPNYLIDAIHNAPYMKVVVTLDQYLKQWNFDGNRALWYGEASPSYLRCESTPYRIRALFPNAKIIVVLRDPVDRAYSNWKMDVRQGHQRESFSEAFVRDYRDRGPMKVQYEYYKSGMYFYAVKRYLEVFGSDNVFIALFEDLHENTKAVSLGIQKFLNVKYVDLPFAKTNIARQPKYKIAASLYSSSAIKGTVGRALPERLRTKIKAAIFSGEPDVSRIHTPDARRFREYFKEDLRRLESLIERDLTAWRGTK